MTDNEEIKDNGTSDKPEKMKPAKTEAESAAKAADGAEAPKPETDADTNPENDEKATAQKAKAADKALIKRLELELRDTRLQLEIKKLENETAKRAVENADRHMKRLTSDFDNYRRRTEENKAKLKEDGIIEAVKKLIGVYDTIKIAVDMTSDESAKSGMVMVLKKFKDGLYNLGVSEIESEGCVFDPNYHDAIVSEPAPEGVESGTILQVLNEGFIINGRVLRHACVKVAR